MKTKLILGTLMTVSYLSQAQTWGGSGTTSGDAYRTGNVGIGSLAAPAYKLDVEITGNGGDGIRIKKVGPLGGEATLRMDNQTTGGHNYALFSLGQGNTYPGAFVLYDYTTSRDNLFIGANGKMGLNMANPGYQVDIKTSDNNDGINVTQTTGGASALHLTNNSSGGRHWALFSTGNGSPQGSGNFSIFQYGANDRFFINGSSGNIGIGTTAPVAKLHVLETSTVNTGAGFFETNVSANSGNVGVRGSADGSTSFNTGGIFSAGTIGAQNKGVWAVATANTTDYAGYFTGNVIINGSLNVNGPAYCTAGAWSSDRKLKKEIKPITNSISKIALLKPSSYVFRTDEFKQANLPGGQQLGLIAQELEEVFPELIVEKPEHTLTDFKGNVTGTIPAYKMVNYIGLIPVLISGIQEQQSTIDDLKKQLDEQKQLIETLTQKVSGTTGIGSVNAVETGFQMSQNEPNPFTHETVVKYTLPQTVSNASMIVYDLTGKQITSFPISAKGTASLTITSENLAAGIYIYSIIADGKVMDSKRMIVADK